MRSLYLSHTGMTEPLGQAQVLPYVLGLTRRGIDVEILSFEPVGTSPITIADLAEDLRARGVGWRPLVRSRSHAMARKFWEAGSAVVHGLAMSARRRPRIVHARSYLPAAAADMVAALLPGAKLLFDMRGVLGEEYVDAGHWTTESFRYRLLKRYERRLFRSAGGVVSLTQAILHYLRAHDAIPRATPVEVIPCCVDTARFRVDPEARAKTRAALGLEGRTVVVYSGTLGSWYMAAEMASFVAALRRRRSDVAWLVLTHHDASELTRLALSEGLPPADLVVRKVAPQEMPAVLAAGDLGLSFIRSCFSKIGSSPTKVAEYLATGLLAVANDGVGDMGELRGAPGCELLPAAPDRDAIEEGATRVARLLDEPFAARAAAARALALARFSLEDVGIPAYERLYSAMTR